MNIHGEDSEDHNFLRGTAKNPCCRAHDEEITYQFLRTVNSTKIIEFFLITGPHVYFKCCFIPGNSGLWDYFRNAKNIEFGFQ